jgi:hypothetical protein
MAVLRSLFALACASLALLHAAYADDQRTAIAPAPPPPTRPVNLRFKIGGLEVAPSGFLSSVTAARSNPANDGISTRFGDVPLSNTPATIGNSFRHTRIQAKTGMELGPGKLVGYVETDFLDRPPAQAFRIRQLYGQYDIAGWEISAGQQWSLLRPSREGIASDRGLMSTRVVDPAYHVGVMGQRNRQVRVTRHMGKWHAAVAFEEGEYFTGKVAHDSKRLHWELIGVGGRQGRYGGSAAAVVHVAPGVDWVNQQTWLQKGGRQALGTAPANATVTSAMQGIEARVKEKWEVFGYGGVVYGYRSSGNRIVQEWTAGFSRELWRDRVGHAVLAGQYSWLERAVWNDGSGESHFVMFHFRHFFGGAR